MEPELGWLLGEAIPRSLWNIVRWITFFFKLVSLAFVVPVVGLIIFDFCLWLWRLYRPRPADSPRSGRLPKDYVQQQQQQQPPPPSPSEAYSTVIAHETESQVAQRRATTRTPTDD
ncbi:hypothetical protein F5Y09DRAFT_256019 [Xylaria sp. FL1042]|nr:hypothetical protein F5Y09DRAFT_256019 [Xylaria sp. FL1042]